MRIKKFTASNYSIALHLVKQELGADALILSTRSIKPSTAGKMEATRVEITAAVESGFVGPQSYDLSQNREYAKAFGLDTQDVSLLAAGDLEAHDSGTGGTTVEMVQLSGETEVTVTG